jgi:EAL and modified HD-GYP domain-containing signal transduction protein
MAESSNSTSAVLGQVALGYAPLIDRQRAVVATRITVSPGADGVPDAAALLRAFDEVWPVEAQGEDLTITLRPLDGVSGTPGKAGASPAAPVTQAPLILNITHEGLLGSVMQALATGGAASQRMLEVPAFMAGDPAHTASLRALREAGCRLMLKGRPLSPLPAPVLACFAHSIIEFGDDRRGGAQTPPPPGVRQITSVYTDTHTRAQVDAAFERGAVAVLGWQFDDPKPAPRGRAISVPPDLKVVMELIQGVDREEPVPKLEAILKRDPTLAFRLLRYLNSPGFGLRVEINSFGHAIMLLGYQRLKRWLAVLLASSTKDHHAKPVLHAAVRRGLIMEELVKPQHDPEMQGEVFICGVFSLLDRLLQQPMAELLAGVPVPERVQLALQDEAGPYQPYLELVQAIENESAYDIRDCADRLLLGPGEVNRALLTALRSARQLD